VVVEERENVGLGALLGIIDILPCGCTDTSGLGLRRAFTHKRSQLIRVLCFIPPKLLLVAPLQRCHVFQ
jgi:hypothetical protein